LEQVIKNLLGFLLGNSIIFRILRRRNKRKLMILCYHRVVEKDESDNIKINGMYTDIESFDREMKLLKRYYQPVSEKNIMDALDGNTELPDYAVWVTLDDGYRDNYANAWPILKKYGIPVTIFLTTGFINREAVPYFENKSADELFLDWEEIKRMCEENVSIGAHTMTHPILTTLPDKEIEKEIRGSRDEIERKINKKVISFAYPNGKKGDYDQRCADIAEKSGLKIAVTLENGINAVVSDSRMVLRRICISSNDSIGYIRFKFIRNTIGWG